MAVARAGEEATPVEPAPVALRPFLQFARLPAPALGVARRVLESDESFRARVAGVVTEEQVGRAGWLFLTRPDGWQDDLDDMTRRAEDSRAEAADRRAETNARRRLAAVEAAARRAEEGAAAARAEAARADDALAEERRARREAARREAELAERADQLAARVGELTARVESLASERDEAKEVASAAATEAARAGARADRLRAELDAARAGAAAGEGPLSGPSSAEAAPSAALDRSAPPASPQAREALAAAARAASALAAALAAAAEALGDGSTTRAGPARPSEPAVSATDSPPPRVTAARRRPALPRRSPAPLPPGILEDSTEAAEHLVRLRGVVLLVDGYNVSHAAWPGTPISEQRRRLVDALGELAARTGADVRVVFDGSDTADPPSVASTSRAVRVRFSPPEVEADDVIVDEVAALPPARPVVVASSDRRVRDESRANGANLLRSSQLLGLLHLR